MKGLVSLIVLLLGFAACGDSAQPLAPASAGPTLVEQGGGPRNPEVSIWEIDQDPVVERMCIGSPGIPEGFDVFWQAEGRLRITLFRHPVTGAGRLTVVPLGVTWVVSANGKTARSHTGGPTVFEFDADGNYTRDLELGLNVALVAPGWGVILLDAGRLVFDTYTGEIVFQAGPHQGWNEDYSRLCEYFAS